MNLIDCIKILNAVAPDDLDDSQLADTTAKLEDIRQAAGELLQMVDDQIARRGACRSNTGTLVYLDRPEPRPIWENDRLAGAALARRAEQFVQTTEDGEQFAVDPETGERLDLTRLVQIAALPVVDAAGGLQASKAWKKTTLKAWGLDPDLFKRPGNSTPSPKRIVVRGLPAPPTTQTTP